MTSRTMRRAIVAGSLIGGIVVTAVVLSARRGPDVPALVDEPLTRGSIVRAISATGTLEAVTTVQVGTQVSGTIASLSADFNSIVRKGQVLARLDPALYQSAIEQARANLDRARADADRLRVTLADARVKLNRAQELSARQLIPATDLEAAEVNVRSAEAQLKSATAQVSQAQAALSQGEVNLSKTVITSPIDGIVIARNVDVGQTVAASLQAPTLFVLAARLEEMQVKANIDESDLGAIREGQHVTFRVDAYPRDTFEGTVEQVRLNPVVEQNVVTYAAIISAPNRELKLKPGLTANVTIEVARRDGVLRAPTSALRFRPTDDLRKAFGAGAAPAGVTVLWQHVDGRLQPLAVTAGISDGAYTEVSGVPEGARVVTRMVANQAQGAATGSSSTSPLMPTGPRPR